MNLIIVIEIVNISILKSFPFSEYIMPQFIPLANTYKTLQFLDRKQVNGHSIRYKRSPLSFCARGFLPITTHRLEVSFHEFPARGELGLFIREASYREYARRGRIWTTTIAALRLRAGWHSFPVIPTATLLNETLQDCLLAPAATGTLDRCHLDLHKCVRRVALEMPGRVLGDLEGAGRTL